MDKQCTKCKEIKDLSCFGNKSSTKGGKYPVCKTCRQKEKAKWFSTPKGATWRKKYQRDRWRKLKDWLLEQAGVQTCSKCPEAHPACLEFHHLGDKEFKVSAAMKLGKNKTQLLDELKKCVVLCSNCHKKEHWQE